MRSHAASLWIDAKAKLSFFFDQLPPDPSRPPLLFAKPSGCMHVVIDDALDVHYSLLSHLLLHGALNSKYGRQPGSAANGDTHYC